MGFYYLPLGKSITTFMQIPKCVDKYKLFRDIRRNISRGFGFKQKGDVNWKCERDYLFIINRMHDTVTLYVKPLYVDDLYNEFENGEYLKYDPFSLRCDIYASVPPQKIVSINLSLTEHEGCTYSDIEELWQEIFKSMNGEIKISLSQNVSADKFIANPTKEQPYGRYNTLYVLTLIHNGKIGEAKEYIKQIRHEYIEKNGIKRFKWIRGILSTNDNSLIKIQKITDAIQTIEYAQAFYDFSAKFFFILRKIPGLCSIIPEKWIHPKKYLYSRTSNQYLTMAFILQINATILCITLIYVYIR